MTRIRTKGPVDTSNPRKKLSLSRKTIRDLKTKDVAGQIKGGRSSAAGSGGTGTQQRHGEGELA
jgi:hypothetical protein